MTPHEANQKNNYQVWKNQYAPKLNSKTNKIKSKNKGQTRRLQYKFKLRDKVKISYNKKQFDREYFSEKWSGGIKIYLCINSKTITMR